MVKAPIFEPSVSCLGCGQQEWQLLGKVKRFGFAYQVCVCKHCGLVAQIPPLAPEVISDYYSRGFNRRSYNEDFPVIYRSMRKPSAFRLDYFQKHGVLGAGARVLEIGPGAGTMMKLLTDRKLTVEGVEPDEDAVKWLREELSLTVHQGLFEAVYKQKKEEWHAAPFDLIVICHALEHLPDPISVLRSCSQILRSDGAVFLEVPNVLKPFNDGFKWDGDFCDPGHLYFFSLKSLARLVRQSGFQVINLTDNSFYPYWNLWCLARPASEAPRFSEEKDDPAEINKIWQRYVRFHKVKWLLKFWPKRSLYLFLKALRLVA